VLVKANDALTRLRRAKLAELGAVDPDALTFGASSKVELVDALNDASDCVDEGGYFTVNAPGVSMMVALEGELIHIGGARRTR
jgi:hypothetical protein